MTDEHSCAETIRAERLGPKSGACAGNHRDMAPVGAYVLEIDEREGRWRFLQGSERFREVVQGITTIIMARVGLDEYEFVKVEPDGITLRTWHAGCFPVFHRAFPGGVRISNHPHLLFRSGETVDVKAQVVAQRISAQGLQVYNPFASVEHLEDTTEYRLRRTGFVRVQSCFVRDPHPSLERMRQILLRRFRAYVREDRTHAIPLSGGYDSRLILCFLRAAAGDGRSRIHAYHEYKSDAEREIAVQVAEHCRAPISDLGRDDLPEQVSALSRDPQFILSAGLCRPPVLRWSAHITRMREWQGDDVRVVGLTGAEAHKGQYYRQIEDLERDALRVFDPRGPRLEAGLSHLGLERCEDFYTSFLQSTLEQSREIYDCMTSRMDFIFYHAMVVHHRGNSSRYFLDRFGNRFPTFDHEFVNIALSLPRSHKESNLIPRKLIADLDKEAARLPYISASDRRMTPRPGLFRRAANRVSSKFRPVIKGRRGKGDLVDQEPGSALTAALRTAARSTHPLIGQADTIIAYNYFSTLEQRLSIGYRLV